MRGGESLFRRPKWALSGLARETVREAKIRLELERRLDSVSDSLFDAIVINEIGPATALAIHMLGEYEAASDAVYAAFERARSEFSGYDGEESPRTWALRYVAGEVMSRAVVPAAQDDTPPADARTALHQLSPERRLAIILVDVLGMTVKEAAQASRDDAAIVRERVRTARAWLVSQMPVAGMDEAAG